jgi:tellurite resistance protein
VFHSKRIERLRDRLLSRGPAISERPAAPIKPESRAAYQRIRPLAEAMYLVMAADRHVNERERDALRGAIRTLTDGGLGTLAMENMIMEFEQALARDGLDVRLDALASFLYGDRDDMELAVALAAAVALADEGLDPEEQRTIEALAERLGISGARLEQMLNGEKSDRRG